MNPANAHDADAHLSKSPPGRVRGLLFLLVGLAVTVLGIVAYSVQISLERLSAPWYMPALGTLGVLLVVISLCERRTVWRVLATFGHRLSRICGVGNAVRVPAARICGASRGRAAFPGV